ncbi:MAG: serine hydrolase domain-containing protein [Ilumatobacteraceae bacterium]
MASRTAAKAKKAPAKKSAKKSAAKKSAPKKAPAKKATAKKSAAKKSAAKKAPAKKTAAKKSGAAGSKAESVGMSTARLKRINPVMQAYIDSGALIGINVRINRRGKTVFSENYGKRDRENNKSMKDDTIFRIYSMTKPVVSTALMLLVEEGKVRLIDPVAKFIPAFAATKVMQPDGQLVDQTSIMQVRHLRMPTSGLSYDFLVDFPVCQQYRDAKLMADPTRNLEQLIDALAGIPLAFQPGSKWNYSLGIDVAARIVEVASGQPLRTFLQERIFGPLGMKDTGFGVPAKKLDRLAAMYGHPDLCGEGANLLDIFSPPTMGSNERRDVSGTYPTDTPDVFVRGGLGLFSTIGDYMAFAQMLCNGGELNGKRIIGRKTLELAHSNHVPAELLPYELAGLPNPGWGFGMGSRVMMDVAATGGAGSVGEFGWAGAAKTYYWVDPAEQLVGVLMTQSMVGLEIPEQDLRTLAYQAIID